MIQIRRVLCPIDFSDTSRRALDYALALARCHHAGVTVLHMHPVTAPVYVTPYIGPAALQPIVLTELERAQLVTALNQYVAADRMASGVEIETILDESLDIPAAILSYAAPTHADLLVLGTHGRSGFQRLVLGSVAEKVMRKAECPLLIVPPHAPDAVPRQLTSLERILCPIDFSPSAMRALEYAASLAQLCRGRLTVLHAVDIPADVSEASSSALATYRSACVAKARAQAKDAIRQSVPPEVPATELVVSGRSHREILRVAALQRADLIAMGVQGRSAVDRLSFGSTANQVVREASCPVLTLRTG